jgi:excisionase family DNA binding protein
MTVMRPIDLRQAAVPRRGLNRAEAAVYVGISPSKFDEMVKDGRMPGAKRIDGRTVWDIRALDVAFDSLPDEAARNPWDEGEAG